MKRLLAIFATICFVALALKAEHFTFMGIPIDGNYETVEGRLIEKGFTPNHNAEKTTPTKKWFTGSFAGYYPVDLQVSITPSTKTVNAINVGFTAQYDIIEEFQHLCKVIESKYQIDSVIMEDELQKQYFITNPNDEIVYGSIGVACIDGTLCLSYHDIENTLKYGMETYTDI